MSAFKCPAKIHNERDKNCECIEWRIESLLVHKKEVEGLLKCRFDDDDFIQNIRDLFPLFVKYNTDDQSESETDELPMSTILTRIYAISGDEIFDSFEYVPLRIDYCMFNPQQNEDFKPILHHECGHNDNNKSSLKFIYTQSKIIGSTCKFTLKLNYESLNSFPCHTGCCMECASLITPQIIKFCYGLSDYHRSVSHDPKETFNPGSDTKLVVFNVDTLSRLCLWIANIFEYQHINKCLKVNKDLMPTVMLTLLRLMESAHCLHAKKPKLYMNRRHSIYFSISRLLDQIILKWSYVKKYYKKEDVERKYCDGYVVWMIGWLMNELRVLSSINIIGIKSQSLSVFVSLQFDYVGAIIVLMTLVKNRKAKKDIKCITNDANFVNYECLVNICRTIHAISHNTKDVGRFFKESIIRSNKLKRENRIKCNWRNCKRRKQTEKFFRCKQCEVVVYCSKHCQKKDWKRGYHRTVCRQYHSIKDLR